MRSSVVTYAILAVLVGFGGSIAVVLAAAEAVSASPDEKASWIMVLCLSIAAGTFFLSVRHRQPIVLAWSTPGAALIAASNGVDLSAAVGAFLVAGALIALTGMIPGLARAARALPSSIAAAILAGVLFDFVTGAALQSVAFPVIGLPMVAAFLIVRPRSGAWAVIAALLVGCAATWITGGVGAFPPFSISPFVLVLPEFDIGVMLGLAMPLYIVTMASQNLPGLAVLRADGFEPPVQGILSTTGLLSVLSAPLGAHTTSLAAITASICTGTEAHPNPDERWRVGLLYAAGYGLLAPVSASVVAAAAAMPQALIFVLAGLALIGPFMAALRTAFTNATDPLVPAATFAVTASGVTAASIGAPFWGLCVGVAVIAINRFFEAWRPWQKKT